MIGNILGNLNWSVLTDALLSIVPALLCITIHELAHGLTAYRLGDATAKNMGRLTLNPLKHIDIFGLLMMLIFRFGWAKPVPVDMRNFKKPRIGMAITAIAGPVSNVILASLVLFIFGLLFAPLGGLKDRNNIGIALSLIQRTAYLSVALAIFNLIPIPPLDGSKVLFSFLSDKMYYQLMRYERFGFIVLLIILNTRIFSETIGKLTMSLYNFLLVIAQAAFDMVN